MRILTRKFALRGIKQVYFYLSNNNAAIGEDAIILIRDDLDHNKIAGFIRKNNELTPLQMPYPYVHELYREVYLNKAPRINNIDEVYSIPLTEKLYTYLENEQVNFLPKEDIAYASVGLKVDFKNFSVKVDIGGYRALHQDDFKHLHPHLQNFLNTKRSPQDLLNFLCDSFPKPEEEKISLAKYRKKAWHDYCGSDYSIVSQKGMIDLLHKKINAQYLTIEELKVASEKITQRWKTVI